jgi:hypothetical protein
MPGLGVGQVASFLDGMLAGGLEKTLQSKLESLGEQSIMSALAGPFGIAATVGQAVETGGLSIINSMGESFLHGAIPTRAEMESALLDTLTGGIIKRRRIHGEHSQSSRAAWTRTAWAGSRDDWLDNHWRHDWRSQPRDAHGRWIPGRLQYIAINLQYRGRRLGRVKLRKQQLKRVARARGRRSARKLFKQIRKTSLGAAR